MTTSLTLTGSAQEIPASSGVVSILNTSGVTVDVSDNGGTNWLTLPDGKTVSVPVKSNAIQVNGASGDIQIVY
jgi:hypothetical protein